MKRRTFLKILGAAPVALAVPRIEATEEWKQAYFNGTEFYFKPENENTGVAINVNDLGKKPIVNQKHEVIKITGSSIPEYNGEFTIIAKDKLNDSMLKAWGDITAICRKPNEIDEQLRARILNKLERNNV